MDIYSHFFSAKFNCKPLNFGSEAVMGDYLKQNASILTMGSAEPAILGFELPCEKAKQKSGGAGKKNGRIDFLVDYDAFIAVVELKNGELTIDHLDQLLDYLDGKLSVDGLSDKKLRNRKGILVGSSVDADLLHKLKTNEKYRKRVSVIKLNRYSADGRVYDIVDAFFPFSIRNYEKYRIEGDANSYPKSRLVLACVKNYISRTRTGSYDSLKKKVEVQGASTKTLPILLDIDSLKGHKYEWAYAKERLSFGGVDFVVCNWWDINNKPIYMKIAQNLGCKITEASKKE